MPNGKPGDHPLTDIVSHKMEVFGPSTDELVVRISNASNSSLVGDELQQLVLEYWSHRNCPDKLAELNSVLTEMEKRLRSKP